MIKVVDNREDNYDEENDDDYEDEQQFYDD